MTSSMLKMLKSQNPDKEYPSNTGMKWNEDEETMLLEELNDNVDIETISRNHNRTIGGINARRREIAYRLYLKNISMEEIIEKTKLDEECIKQTIDKKTCNSKKTIDKVSSLESEIVEMKNEIKELKNTVKELVEMIKAIYEFEDV